MNMDVKKIGERVRQLRTRMGLTTISLARKMGISQAQISRLENGLQGFRSATLNRFAKVLGVPAIYFYLGSHSAVTQQAEKELKKQHIEMSGALRKAMGNAAFLRFLEKCAKAYGKKKGSLEAMETAVKRFCS